MTTNRKILAAALAAVALVAGAFLSGNRTAIPTPSTCTTDVTTTLNAAIAAAPDGSTLNLTGCYLVSGGLNVDHPITISGGTLMSVETAKPYKPIIKVKLTHNVTLENMNLVGNGDGSYHGSAVGQSGIDILSSDHVTISNVTTLNTQGDGLTIFAVPGHHGPTTNLTVSNFTVTAAGRQGITPASVNGATFDHVNIVSRADTGIDFESDLTGVGAANVSITNSTWKGTNIINFLSGPVSFANDTMSGHFNLGSQNSSQPVTVTNCTLLLPANDHGYPPAGINQSGGTLTFTNTPIGRIASPKAPTGPAWYVRLGGSLTFANSPVVQPWGTNDATSTVTVLP